ncbi:hypothetical protein AAA799E16_00896 [Marine Group I thaumarchaeote SCGC AAA799-E16]|uniref:Uncharacterized protein n=4 Tax=Marine Group I TaxID=905826 RepID=A0A087S8K3_9ARCH|nr:hypothetical protein AAA799E16_00896 [Marine Group I thaumarchaeote SCGC AAA799-E16]KFM17206.1 hypothetical protein AAA799D11_00260 [Marine Group I thaumarchaeote SCGC AAA799-D11]KFM19063.1 hypothetical protein SCCGRSA3_00633 [Marine Group I thaumarchaeote SCGC RSA3]KFM22057.1 hypothetical protein AAA799B03_00300 [Marine Group I thaumarchaeote SCGC AAA799-B03]
MLDFLFLIFILPFATAQEIPDYDKPYAPIFFDRPIYSWTDKIQIKIIAPSWNTDKDLIDSIGDDNENPIKVSTRSHSLEPYRLTETDVSSGIFTGEIILTGFLHDADGDGDYDTTPRTVGTGPTNGFLEVERDSAVTVSFEFADGVVLSESVPISWNLGTVEFANDVFVNDDSVIVRVIDLDMNLNPEAIDQIEVEVFSDSDVGGITANAIETSESSGSFVATISLTQNSASSGNRLYAIPGDNISARYNDYTLPKPYSESDNLEIQAQSRVESSVPSTQRLENLQINISDSFGNHLTSVSSDQQVQIVGSLSNLQDYDQKFVYLFQVRNSENYVVSLSWIQGQLSSGQNLDVSQSWTPKNSGDYSIETFVWTSLKDPTALSNPITRSISVE